jgi:hypothetical protein
MPLIAILFYYREEERISNNLHINGCILEESKNFPFPTNDFVKLVEEIEKISIVDKVSLGKDYMKIFEITKVRKK